MALCLVMIVKQEKIFVALTLYLSGDSSKHEVYYNHIYQKGLFILIHLQIISSIKIVVLDLLYTLPHTRQF